MPDLDFQTVSSSQIPDLLNISPWGTRLTLHYQFARRIHEDRKQSNRMKIGKLFEQLILELTAEKLVLEVRRNPEAVYQRHGTLPIGCTVDADVMCPTRGLGIIEAKAIDKYEWMRSWSEEQAPKYYEAQLQTQMLVRGAGWGAITCFIYNEGADGRLIIYERRPNEKAQTRIVEEVKAFLADVAAGNAPSAFGLPAELPLINDVFPVVDEIKVLDAEDNREMAEFARLLAWTTQQRVGFERAEKEMKPKLVDFMQDHGFARLAGGVRVKITKPQMSGQVVMLPAKLRASLRVIGGYLTATDASPSMVDAVIQAAEWCQVMRMPGVQSRLVITEDENAPELEVDAPLSNLEAG